MQFRQMPLGVLVLGLAACESEFVTIAPQVSTTAQSLGPAHGEGYGHLLLFSATYNCIPVGWFGRDQRAYDRAVASVPGAAALRGVTFEEDGFWWVVGSARHVKIDGEAVK